ncbi:MAG: tRNA (N6-isopentenyl adenosine(37)-C2)-methylthiotransferase MiaB [Dehalococcoidia bacterium]|nr:tRNA (N6-isopentenyl adenosine(37)-C2)-methylthiotransferase MiaB [Dehalococcoidia bacterium]
MPLYHIWTMGCQMNKADSERLSAELEKRGLREAPSLEASDLIVLNSCSVRQSAENRVASKIGSLKSLKTRNPGVVIALMGCMVNGRTDELKRRFPHVDVYCRPQEFDPILEAMEDRSDGLCRADGTLVPLVHSQVAAYVPIIQGCDNFCSYCIVPYRRGRERSRPMEEVVCEVAGLVGRGVKEVTLLGQNVDSFGHDLPGKPDLADLLGVMEKVAGLVRFRFLTSHPNDMSQKLLETIGRLSKICPHVNLPVQSGDDEMLLAMRRGYTVEHYRDLIRRMREAIPTVSLSTDVIVGFPGESEARFQRTYDLLEHIRFDAVHVAAYSPRPGTSAARLPDDVPAEEKKRRLAAVESLQERVVGEINGELLNTTAEVLVEERRKGKWSGRTKSNKLVFSADDGDFGGRLVRVIIENTSPWSLQGRIMA